MKPEIYTSVQLLSGESVDIIIVRGKHISTATRLYNLVGEDRLDVLIYIMAEVCLVNGEKRDTSYYEDLLVDDYITIINALQGVLSSGWTRFDISK